MVEPFDDAAGHAAFLRRLAVDLVGGGADADDLAQDAWVELLRKGTAVREARPWSRGVLRNLHWRSLRRPRALALGDVDADGDPGLAHERDELLRDVRALVEALPAREAEVVRLRYFEGYSAREVAARTDRPLKTVQGQLARAQDHLRVRLRARWGDDEREWVPALLLCAGATREEVERAASAGAGAGAGSAARWAAAALVVGAAGGASIVLRGARTAEPRPGGAVAQAAERSPETALEEPAASGAAAVPPRVVAATPDPAGSSAAPAAPAPPRWTVEVVTADGDRVAADVYTVEPHDRVTLVGVAGVDEGLVVDPTALTTSDEELGLRAFADGFACSYEHWAWLPGAGGESERTLTLTVGPPAATLRGLVTDLEGTPLPGADVWLVKVGGEFHRRAGDVELKRAALWTRTGEDGRFEHAHTETGEYIVNVEAPGHETTTVHAFPAAGEAVDLVVRAAPAARLVGTVRDARGRPVEGAVVRATRYLFTRGERGFARTGPDGRYELDGVDAGHRPVSAFLEGEEPQVARAYLDFPRGEDVSWDPVLEPSEGLRITAVDAHGEPLAGWGLRLRTRNHAGYRWVVVDHLDAEGAIVFHEHPVEPLDVFLFGPPPGLVLPYVTRLGFDPRPGEVRFALDFAREPGRLRGALVDAAGEPWEGRVMLCDAESSSPYVLSTGPGGTIAFHDVPARLYHLLAVDGERGYGDLGTVRARPGEDLDLGVLTVPSTGRVRLAGRWKYAGYQLGQLPAGMTVYAPVTQSDTPPAAVLELHPGPYALMADFSAGYCAALWKFEVRSGEETVVDVEDGG